MRIAAIDVGSNSLHMVVAQVEADGRIRVLDRAKERVRLGARTLACGSLSAKAMTDGIRTLSSFATLARRHGVTRIQAVATSAVREAANGGEFVQRVHDEVGLRVQVIPGREEARLIYLGVRNAIDLRREPTLIVDAGGGSVEVIRTANGEAAELHSLKLGVTRLAEQFLTSESPSAKEIRDLEQFVRKTIRPSLKGAREAGVKRLVVTSGTLLNLAAMAAFARGENPEGHMNSLTATASEFRSLRRQVVRASRAERLRIPGLDTKRADIIIPGAILADFVLKFLEIQEVVACTWALREGVLLDFVARHPRRLVEAETYQDPRKRSVARLLRHCGDDGTHGGHVAHLAGQLLHQLRREIPVPEIAAEWLQHAAALHDVGHHIRHQDHQRHSQYLITNSEMLGFQRYEIELIGLVARYHRKGVPKDDDEVFCQLSKPMRRVVRVLSAVLRVADGLDRTHYGTVKDVAISRRGGRITIRVHTEGDDAELEIWEARRRKSLLEAIVGQDVELQRVEGGKHAVRTASVSR